MSCPSKHSVNFSEQEKRRGTYRFLRWVIFWFCTSFLSYQKLSSCESKLKLAAKLFNLFLTRHFKNHQGQGKSHAPLDDFLLNDTSSATKCKKFSLSTLTVAQNDKKEERLKEEVQMKSTDIRLVQEMIEALTPYPNNRVIALFNADNCPMSIQSRQ